MSSGIVKKTQHFLAPLSLNLLLSLFTKSSLKSSLKTRYQPDDCCIICKLEQCHCVIKRDTTVNVHRTALDRQHSCSRLKLLFNCNEQVGNYSCTNPMFKKTKHGQKTEQGSAYIHAKDNNNCNNNRPRKIMMNMH